MWQVVFSKVPLQIHLKSKGFHGFNKHLCCLKGALLTQVGT